MKYAVIKTGGKQYRVSEGDTIEVERLALKPSEEVKFENVLLVAGDSLQIGNPYVGGAIVRAKVLENTRGEKIKVSKFKAKVRYRKSVGHRQDLSKILIEKIDTGPEKPSKKKKTEAKIKKSEK